MNSEVIIAVTVVSVLLMMAATVIWLHRRFPGSFGIVFAGGLGYFFSQVLFQLPLFSMSQFSMNDHTAMLVFVGAFSALAASAARYLIVRWTLSDRLSWSGALSAGAGHAFCEILFQFVLFYMIQLMILQVGDETGTTVTELFFHRSLADMFVDLAAQISAVCFHIALYLIIVRGFVKQRLIKHLVITVALQLLYTIISYQFYFANQDLWMYAATMILIAILACIHILQTYHAMAEDHQIELGKNEGEQALEEGY